MSFTLPADASVLTIFKNYTMFRQFFADFIALGKVAPLPCRLPSGDLLLDPTVRHCFFHAAKSQFLQLFRVIVLYYREYLLDRR